MASLKDMEPAVQAQLTARNAARKELADSWSAAVEKMLLPIVAEMNEAWGSSLKLVPGTMDPFESPYCVLASFNLVKGEATGATDSDSKLPAATIYVAAKTESDLNAPAEIKIGAGCGVALTNWSVSSPKTGDEAMDATLQMLASRGFVVNITSKQYTDHETEVLAKLSDAFKAELVKAKLQGNLAGLIS